MNIRFAVFSDSFEIQIHLGNKTVDVSTEIRNGETKNTTNGGERHAKHDVNVKKEINGKIIV